jgi:O-acetyl-ADP-ribose deacetylase (regulator of RNase III)
MPLPAFSMRGQDVNQAERRQLLIRELLDERHGREGAAIPAGADGQRALLRALMNVRPPASASAKFLAVQDAYLKERAHERGITHVSELSPAAATGTLSRACLWQGDITLIDADAIMNAANSKLLGCFVPGHACIDNAIHTYAGVQLRLACHKLMAEQGHDECAGLVKATPAFNLPSRYVLHTVGPIVPSHVPSLRDEAALRSSYRSCLAKATELGCESVALCCLSTGVFGYPQAAAARVAVDEALRYLANDDADLRVVFNVFLDSDKWIYQQLIAERAGA